MLFVVCHGGLAVKSRPIFGKLKIMTNEPQTEHSPIFSLNLRAQAILSAIIEEHLITGEPVGSKIVAERFANAVGWSSATVRNTMGELEEEGLVQQPHTSAGRVPTDKGYRFYVDNLLGVLTLSEADLSFINEKLGIGSTENVASPERLMEKTSQLLSEISQNIGVVTSPTLANDKLQHIDFFSLSDKRILVVLVSAPNLVHNKVIRLRETFSPDELKRTASYLNREFAGKTLTEIRRRILALMHDEKTLFDRLLQTAIILCSESLEGEAGGGVYVGGASNMLARTDFSNLERLREVLRTIEEKSRLVEILSYCIEREKSVSDGVQIYIGRENIALSLQDCALIAAPYRAGSEGTVGTISVIGSMRIEYARMISIVSYVAKTMEKLLTDETS